MDLVFPHTFVPWFRSVAPYIHAYRGETFVVALAGEAIAAGKLNAFVQDLSILHAMGIKLVLVHGFRPQLNEQLAAKGHSSRFSHGQRITDAIALDCAQEAAGQLRFEIEAAFSQGLPNTPMANAAVRVVSGNFLTARPVTMEDVATSIAIALQADKLMFVAEAPGVRENPADPESPVDTELAVADAEKLLAVQGNAAQPSDTTRYLQHCMKACRAGVERSHIIPFAVDGAVLMEVYTHDGIGTMVVDEKLESLREATADDVASIVRLIEPFEQDGTLVKRDRTEIERDIDNYTVIEHDGVIFGCAALYPYPEAKTAEMAALTISPQVQAQGDGERILRRVEQRAKAMGLTSLFVLTTRTMHWFIKRGFQQVDADWLPEARKRKYNWDRRSQVLVKPLT
jgi:amino-acid N-acetyltransferase